MKNKIPAKSFQGVISIVVGPGDSVAWKLSMLFEAATNPGCKIADIAKKYGYTREHFYVIKSNFEKHGSLGLQDKPAGPKSNYRRTKEIEKQIIRHRFLDPEASCEVIAQKMQQTGETISQRSVERAINEFGLQKKGYIKQIRKTRQQLK